MAYIPEDVKWYLADIVEEIHVDGEATSLVYVNLVLIRADSPEEAYKRSLEVGQQSNYSYENTDGETVTVRFRGLHGLNVIHEELAHGSEIAYAAYEDLTEDRIQALLHSKETLNVFTPRIEG